MEDYFPDSKELFNIKTEIKQEIENIDNTCNICGELNDENSILLRCNHKFHSNCLYLIYKNNNYKDIKFCPYCRTSNNIFFDFYTKKYKPIKNNIINSCQGIIKNGFNKGKICNNKCINGNYCKKHSPILSNSTNT